MYAFKSHLFRGITSHCHQADHSVPYNRHFRHSLARPTIPTTKSPRTVAHSLPRAHHRTVHRRLGQSIPSSRPRPPLPGGNGLVRHIPQAEHQSLSIPTTIPYAVFHSDYLVDALVAAHRLLRRGNGTSGHLPRPWLETHLSWQLASFLAMPPPWWLVTARHVSCRVM
eukprot:COSAG01_NODE_16804_length_1202_cov_7.790571_2_plen_168_part_00